MQILKGLEIRIRRLRDWAAPITHAGKTMHCPVCEHGFRAFRSAGSKASRRRNAICPYCASRERDRLAYLFLRDARTQGTIGSPSPGSPLLHVAPERCLAPRLRELAEGGYRSADLVRQDVDERFDLMDIPHPNATFHAVYCSHVLQDVPDDLRAMAEILRVLKPGGWAILNVPVTRTGATVRHAAPLHVRSRSDGRPHEHLRSYGTDFPERMAGIGFRVRAVYADDLAPAGEQARFGIAGTAAGAIFFGEKPA